jgi:hypothetical protein
LDLSCNNITDVSNIYFCNNTALLGNDAKFGSTPYPGLPADIYNVITCSGQLDMSCNNILDVSRIYFCGKLGRGANWIGQGNSFDISCTDNIKMITADDASMGFFHGSNLELQVDDSHVSISGGTIDTPGLNFLDNEDTGIYRIAPDHIGISTGGIKTVDISSRVTEIIGNNTPSTGTATSDVLEILLSKNSALTAGNGPSIQYEMERLGVSAKKRLNQIQCICTYTSNWGGLIGNAGPVCSTAFTDTISSGGNQTHTERLRIQPGPTPAGNIDGPHVIVDGSGYVQQGWSAEGDNGISGPKRMIHWGENYNNKKEPSIHIFQFSHANDISLNVLQPGIAISKTSEAVTSNPNVLLQPSSYTPEASPAPEKFNIPQAGWLITPPHLVVKSPTGPTNSVWCTSTYGMITNGLANSTIDNIYVPGPGGGGEPCHGTQLILTKVEGTTNALTIRDSSISLVGNIFIGNNSPWSSMTSTGVYVIGTEQSATISFIFNKANGRNLPPPGSGWSGNGWHCTGFHMNVG